MCIRDSFPAPRHYWISVSVGRKHVLYRNSITVNHKHETVSLSVPTPPSPMHAFLTITVCNRHLICSTDHFITRFNLHFEDNLKWFLALPFLSLCAMVLWLYRDADLDSFPLTASTPGTTSRKDLWCLEVFWPSSVIVVVFLIWFDWFLPEGKGCAEANQPILSTPPYKQTRKMI